MQLSLNFPESETQNVKDIGHCESSYIKEFEQGNFSHVLRQSKYGAKELLHLLLTSETAREDLKISLLKKMGNDAIYIEKEMNEEYILRIRDHNDKVRENIKRLYEKEDYSELRKRGLHRITKYNDRYRAMYGGKSFSKLSVIDGDHECHKEYLEKRKAHIQYCISHLTITHIRNSAGILEYYISLFGAQEIVEAVADMEFNEEQKTIILKHISDSQKPKK